MPSPFPGMDPYLEAHWGDVHASLIIYAREQLQKELPRDLRARVGERVFVEADDQQSRAVYPDVRIYERPRAQRAWIDSSEWNCCCRAISYPSQERAGDGDVHRDSRGGQRRSGDHSHRTREHVQ
jgi:hypothetical protein